MTIRRAILITVVVVLLLGAAYGGYRYSRPLPSIAPINQLSTQSYGVNTLHWPTAKAAAIGAEGYGVLAENGSNSPLPTASIAKLITALTVLNKYPLAIGQPGATLTLTQSDVNIYNQYLSQGGSVAQVMAGEQISEYQVLQGMLIPSADNLADTLAIWAYGSLSAYQTAAEAYVHSLGMNNTTIGSDASGLSPSTVSTAHDLILLGEAALQNPVIKQIVAEPETQLPIAGIVYNYNNLLGQDGIIGIKTGNSDQAGGAYLFGANYSLNSSHTITVVGVAMGTPTLSTAINAGKALLSSAVKNFSLQTIVPAGGVVATYKLPWSNNAVNAVSKQALTAVVWNGATIQPDLSSLKVLRGGALRGSDVGTISIYSNGSANPTPVVLSSSAPSPSIWWQIKH